jgi:hypothetical protein
MPPDLVLLADKESKHWTLWMNHVPDVANHGSNLWERRTAFKFIKHIIYLFGTIIERVNFMVSENTGSSVILWMSRHGLLV